MVNAISFPGLSLGPFIIKESFQLFGITIHWYGVIIAAGILVAYLYCMHIAKDSGLTKDNILDILIFGLPSSVICARIYYVVFEWDSYKNNLIDIFKIWEGGIAIYGAVIGACLSTYIYCRIKKISVSKAFDVGSYGLLIGQIFGRWGNFVNAEAYGSITDLPWRMELLDLGIAVHPTFLYESLWNLGVFIFLVLRRKKMKFDGEAFLWYITLYGLGRFWIEGLRTDSLFLGPLRISQCVAAVCVVIGIILLIVNNKKHKREAQ